MKTQQRDIGLSESGAAPRHRAPAPPNPGGPRTNSPIMTITEDQKARFIEALKIATSDTAASVAVFGSNVLPQLRRIMLIDPAFKQACDSARDEKGSKALAVLWELATEGEKIPVTDGEGGLLRDDDGEIVYKRKRSEKLLLALARKFDPELRDSRSVTVTKVSEDERFAISVDDLAALNSHDLIELKRLLSKITDHRQAIAKSGPDEVEQALTLPEPPKVIDITPTATPEPTPAPEPAPVKRQREPHNIFDI